MNEGKQNLDVPVNVEHLLKNLADRLYRTPYACVREYVANAHDACLGYDEPHIEVRVEDLALVVEDNGRGMTREEVVGNFACIAGHRAARSHENQTVGMFGLGVLSAFMVADRLVVETRSERDRCGWRLEWPR